MGASAIFSSIANALTGGVVDKALGMIDKLIPDKNLANQLKMQLETLRVTQDHELEMAEEQLLSAQTAVNLEEAKSPSMFVAGARPFGLWICFSGIGFQFVILPLATWVAFLCGVDLKGAPTLDTATLMSLTTAMLGLAGLRSYDKVQGTARDSLK